LPLTCRDVGHDLEGALLDGRGDLLASLRVGRPHPLASQGFELRVLRPAEPRRISVSAQRLVEARIKHIRAAPAGAEDIPAALLDRLLRSSANDKIAPVARRNLDGQAELPKKISGDEGL